METNQTENAPLYIKEIENSGMKVLSIISILNGLGGRILSLKRNHLTKKEILIASQHHFGSKLRMTEAELESILQTMNQPFCLLIISTIDKDTFYELQVLK